MEKTEAEYEAEYNKIEEMFPNAKFTVSIPIEDLDDVVSTEPVIIVKLDYTCYCYSKRPKEPVRFKIQCAKMTNKNILKELINQNLTLKCNHRFIEGFFKKTDTQYDIGNFS